MLRGFIVQSIEWLQQQQCVRIVDQTLLPFSFEWRLLRTLPDACEAISVMQVRGAPLIGVTAAYGLYFALRDGLDLQESVETLRATRPTAVNLAWALDTMASQLQPCASGDRAALALRLAQAIEKNELDACAAIGEHGLVLLRDFAQNKSGQPVNVLTHCNAGALATVDHGTALAPIYAAHAAGLDVHVWVDETRPRNQGANLTAWELEQAGIAHTLIADNTGGHLMQHGQVDVCIVGSDRTTSHGDVCNKIGTYLKALAAKDNGVPFWVALPTSTIDWSLGDGVADIPIEIRDKREMSHVLTAEGEKRVLPEATPVANYAFDVTPARLVSGLITEHGLVEAEAQALAAWRSTLPVNKAISA
jgi:methylthioribose-1-phosphate isomerase